MGALTYDKRDILRVLERTPWTDPETLVQMLGWDRKTVDSKLTELVAAGQVAKEKIGKNKQIYRLRGEICPYCSAELGPKLLDCLKCGNTVRKSCGRGSSCGALVLLPKLVEDETIAEEARLGGHPDRYSHHEVICQNCGFVEIWPDPLREFKHSA